MINVLAAALLAAPPLRQAGIAEPAGCAGFVRHLPLIERPATTATTTSLILLLTGDGGWAPTDDGLARRLVARGAGVVALNMRSYLSARKAVDRVAADAGCLIAHYLAAWRLTRVVLVGYSRGADVAPFVVTRLSPSLRDRLDLVVLLSPSQWANLEFHLVDLVRTVRRDDDLPVIPEVARVVSVPIICSYGADDTGSACPLLPPAASTRVVMRGGGHRITSGFDDIAGLIEPFLRPSP